MDKSLLMKSYCNGLFLSIMLGESVSSSILWLNPWSGEWSGIDISLMMRNCFFVNFQLVGNNVQVFVCEYLSLSSLLYNRCLGDFKLLLTLWSAFVRYVGLHTFLNFLFFWCDFLLLPFFFNIDLFAPTLLGFFVGRRTTSVKTNSSNRSVVKSTWLGVN